MAELPWSRRLAQPYAAGFTITEVLVALAISLLLSAGLIQVFLGVRQSYAVNEALARLQEDGRFAIQHLAAIVALACHDNDPSSSPEPSFGGTANPDRLLVGYEGVGPPDDAILFDCLGNQVASGVVSMNEFSLDENGLVCTTSTGGNVPEVIVGDIEDWRVLYGVDSNADGLPNRYSPANGVSAGDWANVRAVRLSLLVRSAGEVAREPDTGAYRLLDRTVSAPGDRRLRGVFTATVKLRNAPCSPPGGS